jgi:ribose transport system ATP-binding protein
MTQPVLEVRQGTKRFPGVLALRQVDLSVQPGEVLALIGENGAGKSTLMKVLAGEQKLDSGSILLDGELIAFESVQDSLQAGVALIHQELNLSDNLSVGANIFLGREPRRFGWIRERLIEQEAQSWLATVGLDVSPKLPVRRLTIGHQQLIEIAKALSVNARVLIMDEPTSSLSDVEAKRLFDVIRQLRSRGVSIIYISHRLSEVDDIADRVVVLRDGKNAGELQRDEISHRRMVELMVGRDVNRFYARQTHAAGDVRLQVDGLVTRAHPACQLSFSLRRGEIVALAGLIGAGRSEVLQALFHIDPPMAGNLRIDGESRHLRNPRDAIRAGIALVPEDRKQQGLILEMAVRENISLASLRQHQHLCGLLNWRREESDTRQMVRQLNVKASGPEQMVQYLSGGNQQKVVLGKWLTLSPRILLLDEPTRGVDIGAKQEIYELMERLAREGMAILFVSSEMEEILGIADRVLVMHEGQLAGQLDGDARSERAILQLATGAASVAVGK